MILFYKVIKNEFETSINQNPDIYILTPWEKVLISLFIPILNPFLILIHLIIFILCAVSILIISATCCLLCCCCGDRSTGEIIENTFGSFARSFANIIKLLLAIVFYPFVVIANIFKAIMSKPDNVSHTEIVVLIES